MPVAETVTRITDLIAARGMTPLKPVVWDELGTTRVSYLTPAAFAERYGISESLEGPLAGIDALTDPVLADGT